MTTDSDREAYPLVEFVPGGPDTYTLPVAYIADDFARGPDGTCAFCEGDPCAEDPASPERIHRYMAGNPEWPWWQPAHCPFCKGRPT
jgi:hypothetical protein